MSYYGIYGSLRPSGGSTGASHGLSSSQKSKTLGSHSAHNTHSPGRPTSQYLLPYTTATWHRPKSPSPIRYHSSNASQDQSQFKVAQRSLSPGLDHYYNYPCERSPTRKSADHYKVRGVLKTGNTVWTDLSLRYSKKAPSYKADSYAAAHKSGGSYSGLYDRPSRLSMETIGWRDRLAQQGYVASTAKRIAKKPPERKWHYVDEEDEDEASDDEFSHRTSRGSNPETDERQHDSVIARTKRMRLQRMAGEVVTVEACVQVDVEDLAKHRDQEERRSKRTFISSRHHSWYDTGSSYHKYISPIPWRSRTVAKSSPLTPREEVSKDLVSKEFRKSALNVDLPQSEAQVFAKRQAWRRSVLEDTTSESSPSETGYDSSCTDADRSSGDTAEGFLTDSLDRSPTYGLGSSYRSSQRSTPFGDPFVDDTESDGLDPPGDFEARFQEAMKDIVLENNIQDIQEFPRDDCLGNFGDFEYGSQEAMSFEDARPRSDSSGPENFGIFGTRSQVAFEEDIERPPTESPKCLENLCFRFKSMTEGSSQRDSGFSEICSNQCDSPSLNVESDPEIYTKELAKRGASTEKGLLVGRYDDIDLLLSDSRDFDSSAFRTFEDFDRAVERQKTNVRRSECEFESVGKWSKPARVGLKLDLEACDRFIGVCHDIDDMLGAPTPLTPDDIVEEQSKGKFTREDQDWISTYGQKSSDLYGLDDCTLQLYDGREGDYGGYLDLESTIDEQAEDFEHFHSNRKNAIILRTQLSVRVHAIIEKLLSSTGRELRRALFSLKQIFQDDKDLVHEFVQNDGLACLVKVGSEADQNYQNYILRALGQVMLYVDGMNGVVQHIETVHWLYSLISSKYRLVVKTALKLLLVFVEYSDSNSRLLMNTVRAVDTHTGSVPWSNIMNLLKEKDSADMELLVYAVTLVNKTLTGLPDQDAYYDVVDHLEEQGMEHVITYYMSKQGTDLDLLQQFQIYEAVLKQEDGVPDSKPLPLDARFRPLPRSRKCDEPDRRKSRRHSVGTTCGGGQDNGHPHLLENTPEEASFGWKHDRNQNNIEKKSLTNGLNGHMNGIRETNGHSPSDLNGVTPSLRRRRERDARNKSLLKEQEQNARPPCPSSPPDKMDYHPNRSRIENLENQKNNELNNNNNIHEEKILNSRPTSLLTNGTKKSWMLSMMYAANNKTQEEEIGKSDAEISNNNFISCSKLKDETANLNNVKKDGVKDIQDKFIYRNGDLRSPTPTDSVPRIGDASGIISRAKEGLAASKSTPRTTTPSPLLSPSNSFIVQKLDGDVQWDQLVKAVNRPLVINDLDFTDLQSEEDADLMQCLGEGPGPAPPNPLLGPPPPPPPLPPTANQEPTQNGGPPPPPPGPPPLPPAANKGTKLNGVPPPPPTWVKRNQHHQQEKESSTQEQKGKTKKTVKLFWREVKEDKSLLRRIGKKKTIWDELKPVPVDTQKLEHLFENRAKELVNKEKSLESCAKKSELIVLDTKRSNAINIGMTKLPPPRTIKTAILKMDASIMNREGIEKVLGMLPTEDEKARIAEAQLSSGGDTPLGTAEQFLLTLASVSELEARLRLWAFKLDYDAMEREVAEPLMDLKQAMREIEGSDTFRVVLSTLRAVGNFLNGVEIKGFHIEYLSKVPEVKDTVQKHSLLHHLCHIVMDKFPASTDLYSEIGAVTRASKIDFTEVTKSLNRMESECKASWDYLKAILKHDCNITLKVRTTEFLTDCAERIIVLKVIHRRMINRYHKFLVYLGCGGGSVDDLPVQRCCRLVSEFALEYRTARERVLQQREKKANHRERNKTRGKMITDMERFKTKEQQADHELRQLLGSATPHSDEPHKTQKWGTVPATRGRVRPQLGQGGSLGRHSAPCPGRKEGEGEDDILESLVKTATAQPARGEPRIRKKGSRYGDRKSLRRTLKGGLELSEEEKRILSTLTT